MCWDKAEWSAYRAWKTEIDTELKARVGRSLTEVLTKAEPYDEFRLENGVKSSLYELFEPTYNHVTDTISEALTSKAAATKLIKVLGLKTKAKRKAVLPKGVVTVAEMNRQIAANKNKRAKVAV